MADEGGRQEVMRDESVYEWIVRVGEPWRKEFAQMRDDLEQDGAGLSL